MRGISDEPFFPFLSCLEAIEGGLQHLFAVADVGAKGQVDGFYHNVG